ncbi:MAG: hypothetical protein QY307_04475 [Acidimicrobiia bacterium]|nr:MAG: hypothetical protein QY307_04475 [Acidimicrobiia bacterium]
MDFSKLSNTAKMALIAGAVLIVNLFLPWYGVFSFNANAFDAGFLAFGGSLIAAAGAAVIVLKAMGKQDVTAGQFKAEQLAFLLAAGGLVLIVLRWLTESSAVKFGLFIGVAAAAVATYAAFTAIKEAGLKLPGQK